MMQFDDIRRFSVSGVLFLLLINCTNEEVASPVWVNEKQDLTIPFDRLEFLSEEKNWEATLYSFTQPIPLLIQYSNSGFVISQKTKSGVIQGPGQIGLISGENHYFYDVNLINQSASAIQERDYRSPKTVNPDSSLTHQKLFFALDDWRNIVQTEQTLDYFEEEEISIPPKAGVYQAQAGKPLSSYYVQPGSCTSIPIKAVYNPEGRVFHITAGPLTDKYNNTAADGTIVSFIFNDAEYTYQVEASLRDGFTTVYIPMDGAKTYTLIAKVNETKSNELQLKP